MLQQGPATMQMNKKEVAFIKVFGEILKFN